MIRPDAGCYVSVISHNRPNNVKKLEALVGEVTWFVGRGEGHIYKLAGAKNVIESGGLCESRNAALRLGWSSSLPTCELSDDLKKIEKASIVDGGLKAKTDFSFAEACNLMIARMDSNGGRMSGVAPTANLFYWHGREISELHFVVGDFIIVKECGIFFDETLRLKEDYDYTLAHIKQFGKVSRCDDILATFIHRTNPGGAVQYRTSALEQATIARLKEKWGDLVRDNPKRKDEVLINFRGLKSS